MGIEGERRRSRKSVGEIRGKASRRRRELSRDDRTRDKGSVIPQNEKSSCGSQRIQDSNQFPASFFFSCLQWSCTVSSILLELKL